VTAAALCLAGCGRKGELEMPPGPATQPPVAAAPTGPSSFLPSSPSAQQQQDATAAKTGFDAHGNPVAAPGAPRPFLLDPLLR
jgi:predicted small lipoprotein YifL